MKVKSLVLMMLLAFAMHWAANAQNTVTCYPPTETYATGYCTSSEKTSGDMHTIGYGGVQGWMKFDVSAIPNNVNIESIKLNFYCTSENLGYVKLTSAGQLDPVTASASDLYTAIRTESPNYYISDHMEGFNYTGWKSFDLSSNAISNLQLNGLANDYFTIGFYAYETSSAYYLKASGYSSENRPYIEVIYSPLTMHDSDGNGLNWDLFVSSVSDGNTYNGKTVFLDENISVTTMVGTNSNPFRGTFDGQGHTLTVNISSNNQGAAPFHNIGNGTVIENLKVTGTVNASAHHAGGLVGFVDMSANGPDITAPQDTHTTIRNCHVSTNVSANGFEYIGGIIGHANFGQNTIEGCVYDGTLNSLGFKGGMIGWSNWSALTLTNSYFNGTNSGDGTFDPVACKTNQYNDQSIETLISLTITNFYYNTDGGFGSNDLHWGLHGTTYASNWNKLARTVTLAASPTEGGTVSLSNSIITYPVSGITAYSTGIKYNGTFYAGSGDQISVTATANACYEFIEWNGGSTDNPINYTMTDANNTLTATFEKLPVAEVPYNEGFEGTNDWVFEGFQKNHWIVGNSAHSNGSKSLYITDDNDPANAFYYYSNNVPSVAFASRLIHLDAGTYNFSYNWMCIGESSSLRGKHDYMRAFLVPASATLTDTSGSFGDSYIDTPAGWTTALDGGQCLNESNSWQKMTVDYNVTTSGDYKIVFVWRNDDNGGSTTPAAVDDISVTAITIPYTIATVADWEAFCEAVNRGYSYSGETVTMTANVGTESDPVTPVTTMCGTESKPFRGTFDGQGHTLTVSITDNETQGQAPFQYIKDATIENLIVEGSVTATAGSHPHASGLVGFALSGTNTIYNCAVHTNVTNDGSDGNTHIGGIVGHAKSSTVVLNGCVYDGLLTSNNYKGGFIGWADAATVQLTNCLFNGTVSGSSGNFHPIGCCNSNGSNSNSTVSNCYYYATNGAFTQIDDTHDYSIVKNIGGNKGKHARTVTLAANPTEGGTVSLGTSTDTYGVSGITAYGTGIKYNNTFYAGSGDVLILTAMANFNTGYDFSHWHDGNTNNPYSYTMPNYDVLLTATFETLPIATVPYTEGFEGPIGWVFEDSTTNHWTVGTSQYNTGSKSLYITNNGSDYGYNNSSAAVAFASRLIYLAAGVYDFSYQWKCTGEGGPVFKYDYMRAFLAPASASLTEASDSFINSYTDTPEGWTTALDGGQCLNQSSSWQEKTVRYEVTASGSYKIVFVWRNDNREGSGPAAVDDIKVTPTFTKTIEAVGADNWDGKKGGYYLIASPVSNDITPSTGNGFITNTYDLYYFNQIGDSDGNEWINFKDAEDGNFAIENGKGYLYASKEGTTLSFSGTPYSGNGQVTLSKEEGTSFAGLNLVGNPFSVTAYPDKEFYVLNGSGDALEMETSSRTSVEAMEGIFVVAETDGETMTFSTTAPESNGGALNINALRQGSRVDLARVRFGSNSSLPKMQLNPRHTKVYIPMEGKDYAVVYADAAGTMPVNFKAETDGTYTMNFNAEEVCFNYLHLVDNMTGIETDLLANPSYTFDARTTDYESRFKLVFATGNNADDDSFAFFSNGTYVINNNGDATLQVIDLTGRVLSSEAIHGSVSKAIQAAPGVYMLRLINGNDVKVQKVVVR